MTLNVIDRQKGKSEWLTPPDLIKSLGEFDLDPCSPIQRPWDTAKNHYSIIDNGLMQEWFGRIWMNPPYGKDLSAWLNRICLHGDGIALTFARTCNQAFHRFVFPYADSILFIEGRIKFFNVDGSQADDEAGAPSVLIAYGDHNSEAIASSGILGAHLPVKPSVFILNIDRTWKDIVSIALIRLDKPGDLQNIYSQCERIAGDKLKTNNHYKEKIRQTLQLHFKRIRKGVYSR